jgi:transposase
LYELLEPHSDKIVVTVPERNQGTKNDKRDAFTRAEELRVGAITTRVYKAPVYLAALRNAVRGYGFAVRDTVRAKNRLKALFRSRGVATDGTIYVVSRRAGWLKKLPAAHRDLAQHIVRQLDVLEPLRQQAEAWLLKEAKTHPIIRKLSTAPGMGPIRTAQLVAIVADPHRFRTRQQFWSYSGLGIVTRSSSDWVQAKGGGWVRGETYQTRGLSRKRQPLLKSVFKGAATTVIVQLRDHPLYADYQRTIEAGTKPALAKLTLARRIAAIVLSMWKHQEVYDPTRR